MKTRTNKTESPTANSGNDAAAETESKPGAAFTEGPSSEVWIFDGIDKDAVPYEIDLPHPRTGSLTTFAVAPRSSSAVVGEIRVFKPSTPASFLTVLGEEDDDDDDDKAAGRQDGKRDRKALVSRPELRIATEIDPVFLLLPVLAPSKESASRADGGKGVFLAYDDLMDAWKAKSEHVSRIVDPGYVFESNPSVSLSLAPALTAALERCCDTVMAGDETMYRYSEEKFFRLVVEKAQRIVASGLPPSLEEVALTMIETTGLSAAKPIELDTESTGTPGPGESEESQTTTNGSVFSQDDSNSANTKATAPPVSPNLSLMRLRLAVGFILSNYVPPSISKKIIARLDEGEAAGVDFSPLREQIDEVRRQKSAIMTVRNAISSKRALEEDEGALEREEKRRKKEEEDKKRKSESMGVKALRKVDTSGMKKLSSFFTAKPKAK